MPEPEQNIEKNAENTQETVQKTAETQAAPVREITQTDHLNKKLLTSLFNRMNEGGDSILSKMLESDNDDEGDEEWKE